MKEERVTFLGHKNIRCLHEDDRNYESSIINYERGLHSRSICQQKLNDLDREFKGKIVRPGMTVNLEIILAGITFSMHGFTDRRLTLSHGHDIVIRKSNYVCPRTLCVIATKLLEFATRFGNETTKP